MPKRGAPESSSPSVPGVRHGVDAGRAELEALEAATQARAWLSAIVESADDAIISKRLDGTITSWNPAATRIFGYEAGEMIGQSVLRLIPQELHPEEGEILGRIGRGERIEHYETTRVRKDGRRIRVSLAVSPVRNGGGRIIGASKIARDITAQNEGESALAHLAAIVESSTDAIVSKSLEGIVSSWNPAAERLYGYAAEEMLGQPVRRIIPADLQGEEDEILRRIRQGQRIEHFETTRLHKDGRRLEVSITVSPVRDRHGTIIGASNIARDIGPQREAQRRKDQFLAVLAHELRNPLAPLRNVLALLRVPGLGADRRERAQVIAERQVDHMARLLDDLLEVSRISIGRVELRRATVELRPLVDHAVDASQPLLEARAHRLRVSHSEEAVWLDADPVRITQIVTNLLSNAAKYTDEGGEIQVSTRVECGQAVISVRDNGIGFTPDMGERLFTLFEQDERAAERASGGLGIGLALVREFVERHGGTVRAFSAGPDQGSEFVVRLPITKT